jgi:hypothetical protein
MQRSLRAVSRGWRSLLRERPLGHWVRLQTFPSVLARAAARFPARRVVCRFSGVPGAIEPRPVALELRCLPLKPRIASLKLSPRSIAPILPPERRRVMPRRSLAMSIAGTRVPCGASLSLLALQALHHVSHPSARETSCKSALLGTNPTPSELQGTQVPLFLRTL